MAVVPATERLFFALRPDPDTATRLHEFTLQLRVIHDLQARALARERLHLTLCFLGDHGGLSPQQLAAADAAGRSLAQTPFELVVDQLVSLGHNRGATPLVLCPELDSAPLRRLHDDLAARIAPGLFQLDARPFRPHVTLLYAEKIIAAQPVAPISWMATEVLLIQSHIGRGHHEVLGRYPLG
jgi:2'-5' RNA ligase